MSTLSRDARRVRTTRKVMMAAGLSRLVGGNPAEQSCLNILASLVRTRRGRGQARRRTRRRSKSAMDSRASGSEMKKAYWRRVVAYALVLSSGPYPSGVRWASRRRDGAVESFRRGVPFRDSVDRDTQTRLRLFTSNCPGHETRVAYRAAEACAIVGKWAPDAAAIREDISKDAGY
jgi:hypothetical protein